MYNWCKAKIAVGQRCTPLETNRGDLLPPEPSYPSNPRGYTNHQNTLVRADCVQMCMHTKRP